MQIGVIEAPTIKELFIRRIEDMILTGKLGVGQKLPTERELSDETHISRSVVHAALVELEALGFVTILPRKGAVVANFTETGTLDTLAAIMRHNGGNMTRRQIDDLFETRVAIEGRAMRKLAEIRTDDDLAALELIIDEAEECAMDPASFRADRLADILFRFHHTVCARCGNSMFPLILNAFKPMTIVFWETSVRVVGAEKNIRLLRRYLSCFRDGDGEGARRILSSSLDDYWKKIDPKSLMLS